MRVNVVFFGGLKQDVGTKRRSFEFDGDSLTLRELVDTLKAQYPALAARLGTVAFAVADTLVDPDHVLHDGDEAALLPPVSGG